MSQCLSATLGLTRLLLHPEAGLGWLRLVLGPTGSLGASAETRSHSHDSPQSTRYPGNLAPRSLSAAAAGRFHRGSSGHCLCLSSN